MTIMEKPFARNPQYWQKFGWGIIMALLGALGTLAFAILMTLGLGLVWSWLDPSDVQAFSGNWKIVAIMTAAGLIVGLIHHFTHAEEANVFRAVIEGRLEPKGLPASLLVSLISLVGGFSLGPEVPSGMFAGGLATWISEKRKMSEELKDSNVKSGVVSAYGGLFTSPISFVLMLLELPHKQSPVYFGVLAIASVASVIGFSIFYALAGNEYANLLRILDLPTYTLEVWMLGAAVLFSVLGVALAMVYAFMLGSLKRLTAPLAKQPILRSTLGGFLLGLLAMALPLTLFLGGNGMLFVTEHGAQMGLVLVIVMVFAKMLATSGALSTGFIGGPIFPLLFTGATVGTAVNLIFPGIPLALAVGCSMAALTGALLPAPFMISLVVLLVTGINSLEAVPVLLAGVLSHSIVAGFGLIKPPPAKKPAPTATAVGPESGQTPNKEA
jgi:H+/Cl- antiporter ClcA